MKNNKTWTSWGNYHGNIAVLWTLLIEIMSIWKLLYCSSSILLRIFFATNFCFSSYLNNFLIQSLCEKIEKRIFSLRNLIFWNSLGYSKTCKNCKLKRNFEEGEKNQWIWERKKKVKSNFWKEKRERRE